MCYTWSHSIDNATSNFTIRQLLRGSSDFDLRHNFQVGGSYNLLRTFQSGPGALFLNDWAVDFRVAARSALPVTIVGATGFDASLPYIQVGFQPNRVPGQDLYVDDPGAPGGRRFNFAAFSPAPAGQQGDLGRNVMRGFSLFQPDIALRREF